MEKTKFAAEFELNASTRMLFPYLNTPSGLSEWFADDVSIDQDKVYDFIWDGVSHKARKVAQKINQFVKFEFLPISQTDKKDPSYIEFRLEANDLTQTAFLKITDYSEIEDPEDLKELWNNMVNSLKETIGA